MLSVLFPAALIGRRAAPRNPFNAPALPAPPLMCYNRDFMADESRSLWEIYDSEVPPWRRGRTIVVCIGLFNFALQILVILALALSGNLERIFFFAVIGVIFWLQFYFVWIGVHWLRWLWGAWGIGVGFCLLIWAWRDLSGFETFFGTINMLIGVSLFSPSVYFFARRQGETVRWKESLLFSAACLFILCNIAAASLGFWVFRAGHERAAYEFANTAAQNVYVAPDRAWTEAHIASESLKKLGTARLRYFFDRTQATLGSVDEVSSPTGMVRLRFQFPWRFETDANLVSRAQSKQGPVALHFLLSNSGDRWQIQHMWWDYVPIDDRSAARR